VPDKGEEVITFAIAGHTEGDRPGERVNVSEDLIAYFDYLYEQTGIDTTFFLDLDPFETATYDVEQLQNLEPYLMNLENVLADFFIQELPADLEPPERFGAGHEGEGTEPQEEAVLEFVNDLLNLCREALDENKPLLAVAAGDHI
jgi:hypothetical protein